MLKFVKKLFEVKEPEFCIELTSPACEEVIRCTCGADPHRDKGLMDTLYPVSRDKKYWNLYCHEHTKGCGRIVFGTSEKDCISRWNLGVTHDDTMDFWCTSNEDIRKVIEKGERW